MARQATCTNVLAGRVGREELLTDFPVTNTLIFTPYTRLLDEDPRDVMLGDECSGFPDGRTPGQAQRLLDDVSVGSLDPRHALCLGCDRHGSVDEADPALKRQSLGHPGTSHAGRPDAKGSR